LYNVVLHLSYSFFQKCSKLDKVAGRPQKSGAGMKIEKKSFYDLFRGLQKDVFRDFLWLHSPNHQTQLCGDISKVSWHLKQQFLIKPHFFKLKE
jgi:hypothetical protein